MIEDKNGSSRGIYLKVLNKTEDDLYGVQD